MRELKVVCPQYGQGDAIRKVSSIVSQGTIYTENKNVGMGVVRDEFEFMSGFSDSISRSALASTLAYPVKPPRPPDGGFLRRFPLIRLTCIVIILLFIAACAVVSFPFLYPSYRENPVFLFVPVVILVGVALFSLGWLWVSLRREARSIREKQARYPLELERWERAVQRWEQLYYCYRDDGVFSPNHGVFVPIAQMNQFLYTKSGGKRKREPLKLKKDPRKNRS